MYGGGTPPPPPPTTQNKYFMLILAPVYKDDVSVYSPPRLFPSFSLHLLSPPPLLPARSLKPTHAGGLDGLIKTTRDMVAKKEYWKKPTLIALRWNRFLYATTPPYHQLTQPEWPPFFILSPIVLLLSMYSIVICLASR